MRLAVPDLLAGAVPVAVAPDVHPVPAPALTVARAGQQAVHYRLPSRGRAVGEEGVNLLARGGQAREVERNAAQQRVAVGGFGRSAQKGVNGVGRAGGDGGPAHGRKRPVRLGLNLPGKACSRADPSGQSGQLRLAELGAAQRHAGLFTVRGELIQQARVRLARHHGHAASAPAQQSLAGTQVQPALFRLRIVATRAPALQDLYRLLCRRRHGQ